MRTARIATVASLVSGVLAGALLALSPRVSADPPPSAAQHAVAQTCREQAAQEFLIRGNYAGKAGISAAERRRRGEAHQKAIRWRTEHYGYFPGFGRPEWNPHAPTFYAETTTFYGLRVRLNRRIIPALRCVEQELPRACPNERYRPHHLSGIRLTNTYHTGEITNHAYGIAIDLDPTQNTCCHCTAKWRAHPLCQKRVSSIFERMVMPECWVHVFERFGFYWLGHDQLQDTMHFEFLGDPDHIEQ